MMMRLFLKVAALLYQKAKIEENKLMKSQTSYQWTRPKKQFPIENCLLLPQLVPVMHLQLLGSIHLTKKKCPKVNQYLQSQV